MQEINFIKSLFPLATMGIKTRISLIIKPCPFTDERTGNPLVSIETIVSDILNFPEPKYKVGEIVYLTKEKGVETDILAKITSARCERLKWISDEDCFREGIMESDQRGVFFSNVVQYGGARAGVCKVFNTPQQAYAVLIDKIYGKGTWKNNPLAWVYNFKLLKNK